MNGTDEIIPRIFGGELANPVFMSGNEIDFERELDREFGKLLSGVFDFGYVFFGIARVHVPIIEIVADHRIVFAEADFLEPDFDSVRGIFDRFADGVPAQRRVHVIIRRKTHVMKVVEAVVRVEPDACSLKSDNT